MNSTHTHTHHILVIISEVTHTHTHLNGSLVGLYLDSQGVPHSQFLHVCQYSFIPVHSPRRVLLSCMLCLRGRGRGYSTMEIPYSGYKLRRKTVKEVSQNSSMHAILNSWVYSRLFEVRPPRYTGHLAWHGMLAICLLHKTHPEVRPLAIPYTGQCWLSHNKISM